MCKEWFILISLVLVLGLVSTASAVTYYVDFEAGSDFNSGLSTLESFKHCPGDDNATGVPAGTSLSPGDTVLFKGGVCYRGSITCQWSGSAGSSITYDGNSLGTFGTGRAVIDGSETVTGWIQCQSAEECGGNPNWQNIYTATVPVGTTAFASNMYEDELMLWPSQDPDLDDPFFFDDLSTYRPINSDNVTRTSLTDPSYFTQSDPSYWDGTYILIWGSPNIVRPVKVTGYVPAEHKLLFEDTGADSLYGDGSTVYYAMVNHLLNLTVPGEYVIDEQSNTAYLWPRTGGDISQKEITVSRRLAGFSINGCDYITIQGLKIQKYTGDIGEYFCGVAVMDWFGGSYNVIRSNIMTGNRSMQRQAPIRMYGVCKDIIIEDNYIYENPRNRGIVLMGCDGAVCRNNTVRKNGSTGIYFAGCVNSKMLGNTVLEHTGVHANSLTLYENCRNCLVAYNKVYDGLRALTLQNSTDITVAYNILQANGGPTVVDWGGCDGIYYYNNVVLSPNANAMGGSSTNIVVRNNIIDGGGVGGNMSHNIYTSLPVSQNLGLGEILEEDKSKIFVDPNNRDFHLKADGPAVDAGIDVGFDRDKDGAFVPCNLVPDIGAYEYQYNCFVPPVGDFSRDGVVDSEDLKILTDDWLLSDDDLAGTLLIDLVSHYKFDGDATDSVGGNHGTELGGPTYTSGLYNQAIDLDGTDDYVNCGNDSSFNITDSITLSVLLKGTFNKRLDGIITKGLDWKLTRGIGDEAVFLCLGPGSITGSTNINDNQWHHIAAVYDGSIMCFYVDGKLDASGSASGSLYVSAANVYIGGSPSQSFNGLIDDVRVYNRALSKDEIETLYFGPVTDLVSDYNIDFKDFAVLGEHWLEDARQP